MWRLKCVYSAGEKLTKYAWCLDAYAKKAEEMGIPMMRKLEKKPKRQDHNRK